MSPRTNGSCCRIKRSIKNTTALNSNIPEDKNVLEASEATKSKIFRKSNL
jgi:hypothetical protein